MPKSYISRQGWDKTLLTNRDLKPTERVEDPLKNLKRDKERRRKVEEREKERKRKAEERKRKAEEKKRKAESEKFRIRLSELYEKHKNLIFQLAKSGTPKEQILRVLIRSKGLSNNEAGIVYKKCNPGRRREKY